VDTDHRRRGDEEAEGRERPAAAAEYDERPHDDDRDPNGERGDGLVAPGFARRVREHEPEQREQDRVVGGVLGDLHESQRRGPEPENEQACREERERRREDDVRHRGDPRIEQR
jgi:hypothetical protein